MVKLVYSNFISSFLFQPLNCCILGFTRTMGSNGGNTYIVGKERHGNLRCYQIVILF